MFGRDTVFAAIVALFVSALVTLLFLGTPRLHVGLSADSVRGAGSRILRLYLTGTSNHSLVGRIVSVPGARIPHLPGSSSRLLRSRRPTLNPQMNL